MYQLFTVSTFQPTSRRISSKISTNTALRHLKHTELAEMRYHFNFNVDQEIMETQPIYRSSDESENTTHHSSPVKVPVKNVPDSYDATTQQIASQHEKRSAYGIVALQNPATPPTSLL